MSNLRIVSDNAVDRATLSASSAAGGLVAVNLLTDAKSEVWRATGIAASIHATWSTLETIQAVAIPFCNWSPTASMRVRVTNEPPATNLAVGSESLAGGWSGCTVGSAGGTTYGVSGIPYVTLAKSLTVANESRNVLAGSASAGSTYTLTVALRAGTADRISVGLYDFVAGSWGAETSASSTIIAGPGTSTRLDGAVFDVTGLSTVQDTLLQVTRTYTSDAAIGIFLYPDLASSTTSGRAVLVTRVQCEAGSVATSYYPTTTAAATRPLGYIDDWQSYAYDSGAMLACPAPAVTLRGWTAAQAASAYAYGGGACARMWLPSSVQAYGMAVDIVDTNNLQGYVEAARLVAGPYWSPTYNASDASMTPVDTTELYRTDAGDQGANAGYFYRRVPISLSAMPAADRAACVNILRNSRAYPILLSVFPESADLALERDNMVYGRRSKDSDVAIQYATAYSTTIEIEEI
jgi:hypothetical protein